MTWHPFHNLLVSGGSEGALLHWDLAAPEPSLQQTTSAPRATLSQAHDSNVWSMAFHPLGHLLATASNDHTTRFWSRERPGDATSVFSGGGEKPPDIVDMSGQDEDGYDDQFVPGFASGGGGGGGGGGWYGKEEDGGGGGGGGGGSEGSGNRSRMGFSENAMPGMSDDFIPGFGGGGSESANGSSGVAGRQGGPLPSQEDMVRVTGNVPLVSSRLGEVLKVGINTARSSIGEFVSSVHMTPHLLNPFSAFVFTLVRKPNPHHWSSLKRCNVPTQPQAWNNSSCTRLPRLCLCPHSHL